MSRNFYLLLFLSILLTYQTNPLTLKPFIFTGISLAGIYTFFRLVSKPEPFVPSDYTLNVLSMRPLTLSKDTQRASLINIEDLTLKIKKKNLPQTTHVHIRTPSIKTQTDIQSSNTYIQIEKGITKDIPTHNTIFIFSRGYARNTTIQPYTDELMQKGGGALAGYIQIRDHIINDSPCITFDYPDNRYYFNFGQSLDLQCLETVYNSVYAQHPNADIVLVGDCRGAKCILSFASRKPKNLKAIILMSPFISAQQLTNQLALNYLSWLPGSSTLLHTFFKWYFPNYDATQDTLLQDITSLDPQLPIFIGHRTGDKLIADHEIMFLIDQLQKCGKKNIHLEIIDNNDNIPHSRLTTNKNFQKAINNFLFKNNLPCNPFLIDMQQSY